MHEQEPNDCTQVQSGETPHPTTEVPRHVSYYKFMISANESIGDVTPLVPIYYCSPHSANRAADASLGRNVRAI